MALALLLAAWFTDRRTKVPGKGLFKVVFYMPNIITAATVAILFNALFGHPMGPVNDLLVRFGILKEPFNFLIKKGAAKGIVIFIQTWMWYGYTMIVLISGILGISPDIFEAAEVDGASKVQIFFQITLPNIKTILLFTLVTSLIGGLNMFDIPKLFNLGGPDNATTTTSVFIYNQAFSGSFMYNRAAAASMIMFIIIMICSAILFYLLREKDGDGYGTAEVKALKKAKKGGTR
jgi:multiple sugar transport system permease protein